MGCDIHLYVERQKADGSWVRVPDSKGPIHPYFDPKADEKHKDYFNKTAWDTGRDYNLFARLAGVRRNIKPIAEPRGVPADKSKSVAKDWKQGQGDWHSASYFSAKELLDVKDEPWQLRTTISMKQYKEYLKGGKREIPPEDDNFVWGRPRGLKLISNEEMERMLSLSAFWNGDDYYTDVLTEDPSLEIDEHLWGRIVPAMLAVESNPEKIRIVFWFDN